MLLLTLALGLGVSARLLRSGIEGQAIRWLALSGALLYFADKRHLLRYGRTITGDRYCALEQGLTPTRGLDTFNEKGDAASIDAVRKYGQLHGCTFELQRDPDLKLPSKSDVRILDEVLADLGSLHAWQLEDLSHKEPAWIKAGRNKPMDFIDFFEGHPEAEQIKLAEVS